MAAQNDLDAEEILFAGVVTGSLEEYEGLLAGLRDVDVKNGRGRTLLHVAVRVGKLDWVKRLLVRGANPVFIDGSNATVWEVAEEMCRKYPEDENRKNILELVVFVRERDNVIRGGSAVESHVDSRETRADLAVPEATSTMPGSSHEGAFFHGFIEYVRDEIMTRQEAMSQIIVSVKGDMEELRTYLTGALSEMKVGLTCRDIILEKLEVSVTSLAEELNAMMKVTDPKEKNASGGRRRRWRRLVGVDELPSTSIPTVIANDEEAIRTRCVEAMVSKTESYEPSDDSRSRVRGYYQELYNLSPLISCILRYLQHQSEIHVVIDFESLYIGRIKRIFKDYSGRTCDGKRHYACVEFEEKVLYIAGETNAFRRGNMFLADFAISLVQLALSLAFKNDGRPYSSGDRKTSVHYKKAIEETKEHWCTGDSFENGILEWVHCENEREREVCLIAAVAGMIAYYGSTNGPLRVRRKMNSLTKFYEDHVMPVLMTETEASSSACSS